MLPGFGEQGYLGSEEHHDERCTRGTKTTRHRTGHRRGVGGARGLGVHEEVLTPPTQPWFPKAPPLPAPAGQVIRVATVEELFRAAEHVEPGGTILLADGHYLMPRYFELRTDRVTHAERFGPTREGRPRRGP